MVYADRRYIQRFLSGTARVCTTMTVVETTTFAARTEPYRRELLAHCYRMSGSAHDAEDAVQETYLRAWRAYDRFEERSSVRTWLYRIATNVCLDARRGDRRLEPIPDALVAPDDPAAAVAEREGIRLAFVASLQYLLPRQRAVLLLREVLGWRAAEVADALDTTTAAVKSTLQRARARLAEVAPRPEAVAEPAEPARRALLDRYMAAFEEADAGALEALLRADAVLEVVPGTGPAAGRTGCMTIIREAVGSPGDWRMTPTVANGQPAAIAYLRGPDGVHRPFGVAVLSVAGAHLTGIAVFADPGLVPLFEAASPASAPRG